MLPWWSTYQYYAPLTPPEQCRRIGDLDFAKFKCTTYWACQLVKSQPSLYLKDRAKDGKLDCWCFSLLYISIYGTSFGVKISQMPHLFPCIAWEGVVGHNIDKCIISNMYCLMANSHPQSHTYRVKSCGSVLTYK